MNFRKIFESRLIMTLFIVSHIFDETKDLKIPAGSVEAYELRISALKIQGNFL